MDITAVTSLIGGACTIVKPQLYRRTMLRPLLQGLGHIEGPGTNPIDISGVLEDAIERTKWGLPILIFPEGTRSPTNQIGRFGRVAFEVACRANIPVVSLAITCDPTYLSKQVPLFQAPNPTPHLRIEVLAVDQPESAALDSRQLQKRIEARYQAWLPSVASATSDP
jgi:1-acyl-sn-glycerol-3-phosphate acyltransferase